MKRFKLTMISEDLRGRDDRTIDVFYNLTYDHAEHHVADVIRTMSRIYDNIRIMEIDEYTTIIEYPHKRRKILTITMAD